MKHTPGPWEVSESTMGSGYSICVDRPKGRGDV